MLIEFIIAIVSSIASALGIGGGTIYVIIKTVFQDQGQYQSQFLNLILFVSSAAIATSKNIFDKTIDVQVFKKTIILGLIGSLVGSFIVRNINENILKTAFYIFLLILGIYEIISCLLKYKKDNNNYIKLSK